MDTEQDIFGGGDLAPTAVAEPQAPQGEQLPARFNTDITKGPTWAALPTPYQRTNEEAAQANRLEMIRNIFNKVPTAEAFKAIEAATKLEGALGYDADIRAGASSLEALTKWAPKLFYNNPNAILKAAQPAFKPSEMDVGGRHLIQTSPNRFQVMPADLGTGALEGRPITDQSGEVIGYDAPGAKHVIRPSTMREGATIREQITLNNARLRGLEKQMQTAMINRDKAGLATLQKKHQQVLDDLEALSTQGGRRKAPKKGEIVEGHRYNGGPLSNPDSWEALDTEEQ